MQQDIQQSDQAVDQLITKLAVLLEQANGVLADIIHARRAERRAAIADHPPPEPQQPQDDAEQHQRDEPQMWGDAEPQDDAEPQQPQDDPTLSLNSLQAIVDAGLIGGLNYMVPATSRWLSTDSCLWTLVAGMAIHALLPRVWRLAFGEWDIPRHLEDGDFHQMV